MMNRMMLRRAGGVPVVDLGLISYWTFNTNYNDTVGLNDGTNNLTSLVPGQVNNCVDFSASNQSVVQVLNPIGLSFGNGTNDNPFSISLWVNFNSFPLASTIINKRTDASQSLIEYQIQLINNNTLEFTLYSLGDGNIRKRTSYIQTLNINTWYNIIFTYDGINQPKTYINNIQGGVSDNTGTYIAMNTTNSIVNFGKINENNLVSLNGKIDEAVIANKEWSLQEVDYIYNRGLNGLGLL